jgi:hypothetical protein
MATLRSRSAARRHSKVDEFMKSMQAQMQELKVEMQALKDENKMLKEMMTMATTDRQQQRLDILNQLWEVGCHMADTDEETLRVLHAQDSKLLQSLREQGDHQDDQLWKLGCNMYDKDEETRRLLHAQDYQLRWLLREQDNANRRLMSEQEDRMEQAMKDQKDRVDLICTGLVDRVTGVSPTANAAICLVLYRDLMNIHERVSLRFGELTEMVTFHEEVINQMHDDIVDLDAGRRIAGFPRVPQ